MKALGFLFPIQGQKQFACQRPVECPPVEVNQYVTMAACFEYHNFVVLDRIKVYRLAKQEKKNHFTPYLKA